MATDTGIFSRKRVAILAAACLAFLAFASLPVSAGNDEPEDEPFIDEAEAPAIMDPIEPVNRAFFVVNDKFYFYVLRPVARTYNRVAPESVRLRVHNFFTNVATPVRLVNCLLQGKIESAVRETGRFLVNTTAGIAGFNDPARTRLGWTMQEEDLGQTLAVWGLGNGPYIDWPILGPSTVRDTIGWVGDLFLDPLHYLDISQWTKVGAHAYDNVNEASLHLGEYEKIKRAALDPYIAVRDGYVELREDKIKR